MTKRTILSLPEEVLRQADQWTEDLQISRAEFIRRAITAYSAELKKKKAEEEIRKEREQAFRELERLQTLFKPEPGWDPVKVIREWRDKDRMARLYETRQTEPLSAREKDVEK